MIKVLLCDDEKKSLNDYASMFLKIAKEKKIGIDIRRYSSGESLLFDWEEKMNLGDILFLDIHMPGMDGIEVAKKIRKMKSNVEIIFLTKDPKKIMQAFDVRAFHYILKEITPEEKIREIFLNCLETVASNHQEYIQLSCAGKVRNVRLRDIYYFEVVDHVIIAHFENENFEFYTTLGKLENLLIGKGFLRVHKSYLINQEQVEQVSSRYLKMNNGKELPIGRTKVAEVKEILRGIHDIE